MSWPTIEFASGAWEAAARGIAAYAEFIVDLDLTNDGYPHAQVMILRVEDDGDVVVCETEGDDSAPIATPRTPIRNSTWAIPLEVIKKVTVL
jgi:hypothetical protein